MHGPDTADLAAIAAEWPVIAAELEVTDAECRLAASPGDVVAVRAHRRAVRRLLVALTEASRTTNSTRATGSSGSAVRTAPSVVPVIAPVTAA